MRANSALITLGRKEIKDLTEEVTNHIVDFAEFKKQKEAPKGEKYRTSKLVLSPWVSQKLLIVLMGRLIRTFPKL